MEKKEKLKELQDKLAKIREEKMKEKEEHPERFEPQWPYELFGIECEDGWKPLYQPILDYILEYNKDKKEDEKIEIHQIKEKYGSLRIYLSYYTEELRKMIDDAEEKSYSTCEICGKHIDEQIVEHHWIYPICRECFDNMKQKQQKAIEEYIHNRNCGK